jgi:hypothetical protein
MNTDDKKRIKQSLALFFFVLIAAVPPLMASEAGDLMKAAEDGDLRSVSAIVRSGVDVNMKDQGSTALHRAAKRNRQKVVEFLLASGADVNAEDVFGNTPLTIAAMRGYRELVKLLLEHKANPNTRSGQCHTPLEAAIESHDGPLEALLRSNGASENKAEQELRVFDVSGVAAGGDRKGALDSALNNAFVSGITAIYDVPSPEDLRAGLLEKVMNKLRQNQATVIHSYDVVSEGSEGNIYRVGIRATVDVCKIYELIGRFGSNP